MSARSHQIDAPSDEAFKLVPALRDSLMPGVIVVSRGEQILSCTHDALRLLGFAADSQKSISFSALPFALQTILQGAVARQSPITVEALPVNFDHQSSRKLHITAIPVSINASEFVVVLTLSDVTGIARLQQNLERLDRLATAGSLAAGMAHEVKNALVAVKTFLDLLLEQNKDAELAGLVKREMDRVNQIVRQLLKFGGSAPVVRTTVRMHDVLEHSLRMVQHQLDGKLISLRRAFQAAPDAVTGDNHQLEQVFVNLFMNAVDATGTNGSLTVETEFISAAAAGLAQPGLVGYPHVRITVADTGSGITPENLSHLFQPFFTTKNNGTGLGLPISRRIVEEHQGQITVESQPNQGTTFHVLLPVGKSSH